MSLYGFFIAPESLESMIEAPAAKRSGKSAAPAAQPDPEQDIDYARLGKAIRRNREWFR